MKRQVTSQHASGARLTPRQSSTESDENSGNEGQQQELDDSAAKSVSAGDYELTVGGRDVTVRSVEGSDYGDVVDSQTGEALRGTPWFRKNRGALEIELQAVVDSVPRSIHPSGARLTPRVSAAARDYPIEVGGKSIIVKGATMTSDEGGTVVDDWEAVVDAQSGENLEGTPWMEKYGDDIYLELDEAMRGAGDEVSPYSDYDDDTLKSAEDDMWHNQDLSREEVLENHPLIVAELRRRGLPVRPGTPSVDAV